MLRKIVFLSALLALVPLMPLNVSAQEKQPPFSLTIIHTNDVDAHHESAPDGSGGDSRLVTVVKQIRGTVRNALLLDAGGRFSGTLYHRQYAGQDSVQAMNAIVYQVMVPGNREFDDGDQALADFVDATNFPTVSANVDFSKSKPLAGKIKPYITIQIGGQKVGVIGLTTADTPRLSAPSSALVFNANYAGVVQSIVDQLHTQSINKIILLTHIGYQEDLKLASAVSGVSVIVGGHSHTLLSNTLRNADVNVYPMMVKSKSGDPVAVVQAGADEQYVGRLDLQFNDKGVLLAATGDTIPLSPYISQDSDLDNLVQRLAGPVGDLQRRVIQNGKGEAVTSTAALSSKACLSAECPLGDLVADAVRSASGAQIALLNAGSLHADLPQGPISINNVMIILPYENLVSTFKLTGADLIAVIENGVSQITAKSSDPASSESPRFLQISGLRLKYDPRNPVGSRIVSLEIAGRGKSSSFSPVDRSAVYTVAATNFMRRGADGFQTLADKAIDPFDFGTPLPDIMINYIAANSPITAQQDTRITRMDIK